MDSFVLKTLSSNLKEQGVADIQKLPNSKSDKNRLLVTIEYKENHYITKIVSNKTEIMDENYIKELLEAIKKEIVFEKMMISKYFSKKNKEENVEKSFKDFWDYMILQINYFLILKGETIETRADLLRSTYTNCYNMYKTDAPMEEIYKNLKELFEV